MMVVVGGGSMVSPCCHNDGCHHFLGYVLFNWMGGKGRRKKLRVATWD